MKHVVSLRTQTLFRNNKKKLGGRGKKLRKVFFWCGLSFSMKSILKQNIVIKNVCFPFTPKWLFQDNNFSIEIKSFRSFEGLITENLQRHNVRNFIYTIYIEYSSGGDWWGLKKYDVLHRDGFVDKMFSNIAYPWDQLIIRKLSLFPLLISEQSIVYIIDVYYT